MRVLPASILCLLLASSCSNLFGHRLHLRGGFDSPGDVDEIYFLARRVEGLEDGVNALLIPANWKAQETRPLAPGIRVLADPPGWTWRGEAQGLPHAKRTVSRPLTALDGVEGDPKLLVFRAEPLADQGSWPEVENWFYDEAFDALRAGGDAYVVVPIGREVRRGFEVWGLSGPPLSLVRLGSVGVSTGEGPLAKSLTYTVGALAYGLDMIPLAIAFCASPALMCIGAALPPWDPWYRENLPKTPW